MLYDAKSAGFLRQVIWGKTVRERFTPSEKGEHGRRVPLTLHRCYSDWILLFDYDTVVIEKRSGRRKHCALAVVRLLFFL